MAIAVGVAVAGSVGGLVIAFALSVELGVDASPSAVLALALVAVYLLVAAGRAVARRVRLRPVAADEAAAADARVGVA